MWKRKILQPLLLVLVSTIATLLVLEVALRLFYPQQEAMRWFESSAKYGYVLKKNFSQDYRYEGHDFVMHVRTNSFGHRYREYDQRVLADGSIRKVLLLGDSYFFGDGINMEDHLAKLLEKRLNEGAGGYTVLNAGVSGWGTLQEISYAMDHFESFKPDVIVLLLCGNDPDDDDRFLAGLGDRVEGVFKFPGKTFLRNHSHLYRFLFVRFGHALFRIRVGKMEGKVQLGDQCGYVIAPDQWARTTAAILEFHESFLRFNRNGLLLLMVATPWDPELQEKMIALSNGRSLHYVDLAEVLSLPLTSRSTEHDGHWSAQIHEIVSKKLSGMILDLSRGYPEVERLHP